MMFALNTLSTNVVMANPARPSGPGSAVGAATGTGRDSSGSATAPSYRPVAACAPRRSPVTTPASRCCKGSDTEGTEGLDTGLPLSVRVGDRPAADLADEHSFGVMGR